MNHVIANDNWGTRSGIDRRQRNIAIDIPDRRVRIERQSGLDRRGLLYLKYREELDLRQAFRDLG